MHDAARFEGNLLSIFTPSVPVIQDSVRVEQHAQYQESETKAAKWNSAIIHVIMYPCAFAAII